MFDGKALKRKPVKTVESEIKVILFVAMRSKLFIRLITVKLANDIVLHLVC